MAGQKIDGIEVSNAVKEILKNAVEKLKLEGKVNKIFVVGPAACFGPWR